VDFGAMVENVMGELSQWRKPKDIFCAGGAPSAAKPITGTKYASNHDSFEGGIS
jgi:hypothetical protein